MLPSFSQSSLPSLRQPRQRSAKPTPSTSAQRGRCRTPRPAIPPGPRAGEDSLKIRALLVDGVLKEWTTGDAHDVTDRSFVVRRVIRLNDALPTDKPPEKPAKIASNPAPAASHWVWQRGPWLLVDRVTGHVTRPASSRLRSRRQPGELVPRLRGLLRCDGERQEPLRRGGAGGGAQAGPGQKTRGLRS